MRAVALVIASVALHALGVIALWLAAPRVPMLPVPIVPRHEIELEPPPPPEPPPQVAEPPPAPTPTPPPAPPPPTPAPPPPPTAHVARSTPRVPSTEPAPSHEPAPGPSDVAKDGPPGDGAPVIKMEDLGKGTMAIGKGGTGGGGGSGSRSGTGAGSGSGSAAAPMSIAAIKTRAKPKGDYGYFDARKDYPAEAKQLAIEGQIKVRLTVDEHGKVTKAVLLTRLGHGLDELALSRAQQIQFEPALDDHDRPVASIVVWTFTFTLPD